MSALVDVLRWTSVAVFAAPLLLRLIGPTRNASVRVRSGPLLPLIANVAAFALFFPALVVFRASPEGQATLILAATGCLIAVAGAAVIVWSRMELGAAWSLAPEADEATGLVTSGPYRLVRHPLYLGFFMLTGGEGLAFASWPALMVILGGIVPTFLWRASVEEELLQGIFGERFALYRQKTRMVIPYLF
jgi:protein-S-isoprenylcysteine O-methyltransferase Ste14